MDRLNLNLLRALTVLLQDRNVTQAALRLNLTQSAMSRQLTQLRDYFADPLLIREGNSYLLSARARQLLPQVQAILSDIEMLRTAEGFDPSSCRRRFSFACTDYVAEFIFPDVLKQLQLEAPGIDISYKMWQPDWLERLGQLPLDMVSTMTASVPKNLFSIHMGQDKPVCLMAGDHPLTGHQKLSLELLLNYSFVHLNSGGDKDSFFDRALEAKGLRRRILFEVPFFSSAFQVVADSRALMILPEHIARNAADRFYLSYLPLPLSVPKNHYHLCWHAIHDRDPAHCWVRNCIAEQIRTSMYSP
ncbi:LysR family transcriptional regulator [Motiliproteus sp. MSK22-1]|uniref:LysR family transcriptional regulator n=1 Tax=Motiliproteus sp. MSK22-1 TaxID=1897630 RepID=UPI000975BBFC|nr:LysR family transcriptional regulator [Motiliproteus sp. MSK22-1]OMH39511.1 hypothetical protein BGP75_02660 [Motiliproteus sp. MSK22-1]